jgi:hypothetical protein
MAKYAKKKGINLDFYLKARMHASMGYFDKAVFNWQE